MNRLVNVRRLTCALVLVGPWLALSADAQAQTPHPHRHRHRSLRPAVAGTRRDTARVAGRLAAHSGRSARALHAPRRIRRAVIHAHMTGDPAVSIVDFSFSPATTTIHVGDTITWTNTGRQPHSATANDHSFDTGILHAGQSGSHTFNSAGTFSYFCIVHPFMKGTIVVLAAAAATSTTPTTTTSTTTPTAPTTPSTSTAPTTSGGQTLPFTGENDLAAFALGLLLVGGGFGLRARVRAEVPNDSPAPND